jgi:hypothetical protein
LRFGINPFAGFPSRRRKGKWPNANARATMNIFKVSPFVVFVAAIIFRYKGFIQNNLHVIKAA